MPRPDRSHEKRKELIPTIARAFAELGYRRATTAQLATRCGVQETILYRLWPDKKAMFIASINYVYEQAEQHWKKQLDQAESQHHKGSSAELLLSHEADHHGESGLHRIIHAGLSETDDDDVRKTLRRMYGRFHKFIFNQIMEHRGPGADEREVSISAWAIVALGNIANIGRELKLLTASDRATLIAEVGHQLLDE